MITATGYKSKFKFIKFVKKFTGFMICKNCRSCVCIVLKKYLTTASVTYLKKKR